MTDGVLDGQFCRDSLRYYPIDQLLPGLPHGIGILMVVAGLVNVLMSIITVVWIKRNELAAQSEQGEEEAAKSVIFPVFVRVLWLTILSNLVAGVITFLVPFDPAEHNDVVTSLLYALVMASRHFINEGIAFLLMRKGCGFYAAKKALRYALIWGGVTFGMLFYVYLDLGVFTDGMEILWDFMLLSFHLTLWLAPEEQVFRRPAVKFYSKFWSIYAICSVIINILFLFDSTLSVGNCAYVLTNVILVAIFSPLIIYWTLLQDSRWWQGIDIMKTSAPSSNASFSQHSNDSDGCRLPLLGTDISLASAQSLAATMDVMRRQRVRMLNFASIRIDFRRPLGGGSFSKVYQGKYRGQECAIKLIYTPDLTTDVIQRVAAEASILSAIQNRNIVEIYGVSVLPPSVCLILEICQFGSLSDVLRGYGFDWNRSHRAPLVVSRSDMLFLALGCARGLAGVHALDSSICHRDVKSFNFLVDRNFQVKIADLELGLPTALSSSSSSPRDDSDYVDVDERLANWLAPEVITQKRFIQPSDVYALGTVLWEIFARRLPFEHDNQATIRQKLLEGYQHPMPPGEENTDIALLIRRCWSMEPLDRPTATEVVLSLEALLTLSYTSLLSQSVPSASGRENPQISSMHISAIHDFYEERYRLPSSSALSVERSSSSVFRMSHYGRGGTGGHRANGGGWWTRWFRPNHNRGSMKDNMSDFDTESLLRDSMYALPKVRALDLLSDEEKSRLPHHKPLPPLPSKEAIPMVMPIPPIVQESIGIVKTERFWRVLENQGEAWAAVTSDPPHIVLHATSFWFSMFHACSCFGKDHHLWSLQALINPTARAPDGHCSASNTYAMSVTQDGHFDDLSLQCANMILPALRDGQEVHGVLCFHLIDRVTTTRSFASSSSSPLRGLSLSKSRGSFSDPSKVARGGHNMMCSVHAYPVFPSSDRPFARFGEGSPVSAEDAESILSPGSEPTSTTTDSRRSALNSSRQPSQGTGSGIEESKSPHDLNRPMYHLIQFNELLELDWTATIDHQSRVQSQSDSWAWSSYRHGEEDEEDEAEEEDGDSEGNSQQGFSFLGLHIPRGRFWTNNESEKSVDHGTGRYHSLK